MPDSFDVEQWTRRRELPALSTDFAGYPGSPSLSLAVLAWCEAKVLSQGFPSFYEGDAWYRTPDGLYRDPVGWLIPDSDYRFEWESTPCNHTLMTGPPCIGNYLRGRGFDLDLLVRLQCMHDNELRVDERSLDIRPDWAKRWVTCCQWLRENALP